MPFFTESWFYRGVQSALFYYVSLSPCLEYKYKRKRRKEATRAQKEREEIISTQPGIVRQPAPFQTNEDWAEEIVAGPGPPKGWKKDKMFERLSKKAGDYPPTAIRLGKLKPPSEEMRTETVSATVPKSAGSAISNAETAKFPPIPSYSTGREDAHDASPSNSSNTADKGPRLPEDLAENEALSGTLTGSSEGAGTGNETLSSPIMSRFSVSSKRTGSEAEPALQRPSMDRRLSTAMDNIKDTIRTTLHPDRWNWIRYDREDEILTGFNERMSRMWDKVTGITGAGKEEPEERVWHGRKRAETNDSEQATWARGRHPAINDLHPPIVSQLPATREEARWMLLPPPSSAVMAGKLRPGAEAGMRWPLAIIGRDGESMKNGEEGKVEEEVARRTPRSSSVTPRTPDLSTTSEETWSDEWDGEEGEEVPKSEGNRRRRSAPIATWAPMVAPTESYFDQKHGSEFNFQEPGSEVV